MFGMFKKKSTNYGKIIAITLAVVAAAGAIAFIVYKLIKMNGGALYCGKTLEFIGATLVKGLG